MIDICHCSDCDRCQVKGRESDERCTEQAVVEMTLRRGAPDGPPAVPWLNACRACADWMRECNTGMFYRERGINKP